MSFFFLRVTSVLRLLRGRRSGRARCMCKSRNNALVPDGCSCGTGNQAQLTFVALVSPVAQETLTSLLSFYDTIRQRQCVHSGTQLVIYSGRTLAYLQPGKKGPRHEFVPVSSREHHQRRAGACDRPNWAGDYSQGDHEEKKQQQFTTQED